MGVHVARRKLGQSSLIRFMSARCKQKNSLTVTHRRYECPFQAEY
ncbi:hypothetical protein [Ornithinibacillus halotolerans]|nr:hypothetical protein [Ornithinibacillus halotolerans]